MVIAHTTARLDAVMDERAPSSRRPVALAVEGVSKTYPSPSQLFRRLGRPVKPPVAALTDVSLTVHEGEVFGLIGRNGAGKTTLAKIIATLVQPTSGTVTVNGQDSVRDDEQVRGRIGLASAEERSFYWRLTVEQNLMFFARLYGLSDRRARERVAELLALLQLGDSVGKRFGQLSTGNKQRMAVARALLNAPPVLLLDEPTRSLDPLAAARMRALIASLAQGDPPVTILLTSHNLTEVEELCARVAVISRGRIRAAGAPAHIRALHGRRERVRLSLGLTSGWAAARALEGVLDDVELEEQGEQCVVTFTREVGDDLLDRSLRALMGGGARLLGCDVERPTLLDVLETYESEEAAEGGGTR